jgi:uncharacterized membrane protein YfhO
MSELAACFGDVTSSLILNSCDLHEQFWPGWQVSINGRGAPLERWGKAFQAVWVPPGDHRVQFRFRSRGLGIGAWVSLASLFVLLLLLFRPGHGSA